MQVDTVTMTSDHLWFLISVQQSSSGEMCDDVMSTWTKNQGKRGSNEDRPGVPNEVSAVIISAWADLQSSPHLVQVRGESKPRHAAGSVAVTNPA